MTMKLLEVRNLKTYFDTRDGVVRAVDDVSFFLEKGEAIGLVGESGCGKTTTALSVLQLLPKEGRIAGGQILLNGEDFAAKSEEELRKHRWRDVSIVFQGAMNALNPVMKVSRQIAEALLLHEGLTEKEARRRVLALFDLVEISSSLVDCYPHEFSGGMRQRAMIAMALACGPKLIVGDEPTTALDVVVQAQILALLGKLRREFGMAMILITHDLSIVGANCDQVAVMYGGKVAEIGPVGKVLRNPCHPYTQRLLKAFPDIRGEREMVQSIPGFPPNLVTPPPGCRFSPRCDAAGEICFSREPAMRCVEPGHEAACHFAEERS
jgi:peptide/nickel transport system ATP-binding protein